MAENTTVEVHVVRAGEIAMPHAYVYRPGGGPLGAVAGFVRPGGKALRAPLLWFAVRHPTAGVILIDTGLHPDALRDLRGDYGLRMSLLFRGLRPAGSFDEQLAELEIEPDDVELVVMTHLHVDHTSGMRLLPNAEFVCSREEWAAATGRSAAGNGYVAGHLPPVSRMRLVDFDAEGEPQGPFTRTIDLLGDGSVRLLFTPGHTRGHLSLLLRVPGAGQVLVIGDAVYTLRSLEEEALPLRTAGDSHYLRSLREIKAFAEEEPEAVLVPTHDPDAWRALAREGARAATYST